MTRVENEELPRDLVSAIAVKYFTHLPQAMHGESTEKFTDSIEATARTAIRYIVNQEVPVPSMFPKWFQDIVQQWRIKQVT